MINKISETFLIHNSSTTTGLVSILYIGIKKLRLKNANPLSKHKRHFILENFINSFFFASLRQSPPIPAKQLNKVIHCIIVKAKMFGFTI